MPDGAETLVLPVTLYRHPNAAITNDELVEIGEEATKTWFEAANIRLEPSVIEYPFPEWFDTSKPPDVIPLADALVKHYRANPPPRNVLGFYGPWTNGDNGTSLPHRYWNDADAMPILPFFVRDHMVNNSPPLARVTAHEIGHILRLPHYIKPTENLMASNQKGTDLDPLEIDLARAGARWLLHRSS